MCSLFEADAVCASVCSTCGTLCEAFPIEDYDSLRLYGSRGCNVVVGDVYLQNLPGSVTKSILFDNLKTVQYIRGMLFVKNNPVLSAMTAFSNLIGVTAVVYSNNPALVDARIPSLEHLTNGVVVEGCDRLCPSRYTTVGSASDDSGCANPVLEYFFYIAGDANSDSLPLLESITYRVMKNVTSGVVCNYVCMYICVYICLYVCMYVCMYIYLYFKHYLAFHVLHRWQHAVCVM